MVFLEIHPFQDGNGRLSRVLTTLLLLQAGYAYVPYSSLESVIEQSKEAYYLALRQTQGTIRTEAPNWQPWLVFFLRALAEQVRRLKPRSSARSSCWRRCPNCRCRSSSSPASMVASPWRDAIRLTGASRNTLKQHFRALAERGTLAPAWQRPRCRGTTCVDGAIGNASSRYRCMPFIRAALGRFDPTTALQ